MYTFCIGHVSNHTRVLIGGLGISALGGDVSPSFPVLTLIASDHVDRLLEQVEVEVLIAERGREVKISIYKGL